MLLFGNLPKRLYRSYSTSDIQNIVSTKEIQFPYNHIEPHYILTKRSVKSKQRPYVSKIQNIFLTKSFWNGLLMTMILRHRRIRTNCWQHSPFVMIFLTKNSTNTTKITKIYWSNQSKKVAFHKATFLFLCKPFCMVLHFFINFCHMCF